MTIKESLYDISLQSVTWRSSNRKRTTRTCTRELYRRVIMSIMTCGDTSRSDYRSALLEIRVAGPANLRCRTCDM